MPKFLLAIAIAFGVLFFNSLSFAQDSDAGLNTASTRCVLSDLYKRCHLHWLAMD